jgi:hypothetical protein
MRRCGTQVQEEQHAGVPLCRVRAVEGAGRLFSTPSRPALRAAACGGRPRPAGPTRGDHTPTSKPRSTSLAGVPPRIPQLSSGTSCRTISTSDGGTPTRPRFVTTARYSRRLASRDRPPNIVISTRVNRSPLPGGISKASAGCSVRIWVRSSSGKVLQTALGQDWREHPEVAPSLQRSFDRLRLQADHSEGRGYTSLDHKLGSVDLCQQPLDALGPA